MEVVYEEVGLFPIRSGHDAMNHLFYSPKDPGEAPEPLEYAFGNVYFYIFISGFCAGDQMDALLPQAEVLKDGSCYDFETLFKQKLLNKDRTA